MNRDYQICTRCIMDTTDPKITFDEEGICNHCRRYERRAQKEIHYDYAGQIKLQQIVDEIKKDGKNKEYDCIIGLSGGVDSTTVAYRVKQLGLRPLAVHLDNGWDDELAANNVENILKKLDIDLLTYVLDWDEFKDLQLSFLKASVPNCEIPTDHAIVSLLYHTATKKNIRYIISGGNIVTEAIMPFSWGYRNMDWKYIKSIHKKSGTVKLKTFPHLSLFDWVYYSFAKRIKVIPVLNYIPYVKQNAKKFIEKELGWKDYGPKHFESIYTRFFQAYILPTKFGFDKRKAHLSTLICSGQMTRQHALEEMKHSPYPNDQMLKEDRKYVLKKLGLTEQEFERIMFKPVRSFKEYPNNNFWFEKLNFVVVLAHKIATCNY